jgi:hypothetical protein
MGQRSRSAKAGRTVGYWMLRTAAKMAQPAANSSEAANVEAPS